jgi:integrase/recombinase XerD
VSFLTAAEVEALLSAPDRITWVGRRDHTLIATAVQTGLRASELIGLRTSDVHLGVGPHISCLGKGRKQRITPLTKPVVALLRSWLSEPRNQTRDFVFTTRSGGMLSRDALEHRLADCVAKASNECLSLRAKRITLHVLRHTAAMRLLRAGIDLSIIALSMAQS